VVDLVAFTVVPYKSRTPIRVVVHTWPPHAGRWASPRRPQLAERHNYLSHFCAERKVISSIVRTHSVVSTSVGIKGRALHYWIEEEGDVFTLKVRIVMSKRTTSCGVFRQALSLVSDSWLRKWNLSQSLKVATGADVLIVAGISKCVYHC